MGVVRDGGTGIGVNPNGHYFPFVKEVGGAERLFADMYLGHRVESAVLPLRLSYIQGFTQPASYSPSNRAELIVIDADDNVVFNSHNAADYRYNEWSDRFTIHEWISDSAVCRIVQHTGQNDLEDVIDYPFEQTLTDAVLDERVSELWPKCVTKIIANGTDITGDLEIHQGYNFETSLGSIVRTGGQSRVNSVFVSAQAGAGEGLAPGCEEAIPLVRRINQQGPTAGALSVSGVNYRGGSFVLSAGACLSIIRPATFVSNYAGNKSVLEMERDGNSGIMINNNCLPCCSCDDFVNTYKGIRKLYDTYAVLGNRANIVRDRYSENVNRWLAQKECREALPIKTGLMPYKLGTASGVKAVVGVCNSSGVCKGEVEATINFEVQPSDSGIGGGPYEQKLFAIIHPDSVFSYVNNGIKPQRYSISGDWPEYKVKWDLLESQDLARVKFDMILSRGGIVEYNSSFDVLNRRDGDKLFDGRISIAVRNRKQIPQFVNGYNIGLRGSWGYLSGLYSTPVEYDLDFSITCPDPETGEEVILANFKTGSAQHKDFVVVGLRGPANRRIARCGEIGAPCPQSYTSRGSIPSSIYNKFIVPGTFENPFYGQAGVKSVDTCRPNFMLMRSYNAPFVNDSPYGSDYSNVYGASCTWPAGALIDPMPNSITNLPLSLRLQTNDRSHLTSIASFEIYNYFLQNPGLTAKHLEGSRWVNLRRRVNIGTKSEYYVDGDVFYTGPVFIDAIIPPVIQTKIFSDDYITMNVSARVLDDPTGKVYTASETAGLKDIP
jgi:hypothetical protein